MTAFALNIAGATGTAPITALVTLADGLTKTDTFTAPQASGGGFDFLGIDSINGSAITSVKITDGANFPSMVVDGVTFGQAIPEPKTYVLIGLAGIVLLAFRRHLSII